MIKILYSTFIQVIFLMLFSAGAVAQEVTIECGAPALEESYCYTASDSQTWLYTASGTGSLRLVFDLGTIENSFYDGLVIYDGSDASGDTLFVHNTLQANLGPPGSAINNTNTNYYGIDVVSITGSLFMVMYSDASVQCAGSTTYDPWIWRVFCTDCIMPVVSFNVVSDCVNFQYMVEVDITDLGSADELTITNSLNAVQVPITAPGTVTAGPFAAGSPVQITVVNGADQLCDIVSPALLDPFCPTLICGTTPMVETYCYTASDDQFWAYGLSGDGQIRLVFNRGSMESASYDRLRIYDGPDASYPLLFDHTQTTAVDFGPPGSAIVGPGNYYYSVDVLSTGPDLYMTLTSDGSIQCQGSTLYDPMEWEVSCEGCQAPGVNYVLDADCEHLTYKAKVNVTDVTGPLGLHITEMTSGESMVVTEADVYEFDTVFGLDTMVAFMVTDLSNAGCTYQSGPMVYTRDSCVINSCGIDNYTLCYGNNEDRWFTYRSEGEFPVAIYFHQGQMLPNDMVTLYNGLVNTTQNVIFTGDLGGNLAGLTANSSNLDNAITLRIRSDAQGSCADGAATVPLHWDVGCGFVGINDVSQAAFSLYPNPSTGLVHLDMGDGYSGPVTLRVLDMSGRLIFDQTGPANNDTRTTIDLSHLQNGQYLMQMIATDRIATRNFQIMR